MHPNDAARARVDDLFARFRGREVPMWTGDLRSRSPEELDEVRERAFTAADEAGRGGFLNVALERIEQAYALRSADAGYWTGIYAINSPWDAASRAQSQMIVEDLVIATVVEDLVPESVTEPLRADGERLLRLPPADPRTADDAAWDAAPSDDGQPPIEPFSGPLVFAARWAAIGLLALLLLGLLVGTPLGFEAFIALLLIGGAVLVLRQAVGPS